MGTPKRRKRRKMKAIKTVEHDHGRRWTIETVRTAMDLPRLHGGWQWYVARVLSRNINRTRNDLECQLLATFHPTWTRKARRERQERETYPALIPGYLFIGSPSTASAWAAIRNVEGVIDLLGTEAGPLPIPDAVMRRLEWQEESEPEPIETLRIGSLAFMKDGPFAQAIGQVHEADREFAWLLVDLLGRKTIVKAPLASLEPVC
jgi:transcription antitermination factor NusG